MWLFLSDAFLSIVDKDCADDELCVRARRKGDIERVFPGVKVHKTIGNDYLFRAYVKRDNVGAVVGGLAAGIDYSNFKNTIRDNDLHHAAHRVWSAMADLQPIAPYSRAPGRGRR